MKISRENYEIWFADWLENQLSGSRLEELKMFLDENPDKKKEFDDLSGFSIHPTSEIFNWKGLLKRDLSEIPSEQFDLLCAARLEDDLDPEQLAELSEIITSDTQKKRTADLFSLTKLNPSQARYGFKNRLYRRTLTGSIIRLALPVLSAAAILALLLMTGVLRKTIVPAPENVINITEAPSLKAPASDQAENPEIKSTSAKSSPSKGRKEASSISTDEHLSQTLNDNSASNTDSAGILPVEVKPVLHFEPLITGLAGGPSFSYPGTQEYDEERSRIGKFLARTFREKVLDEAAPSDKPLKAYEIAEAGITGINKLLGWEMALTRNTDDNGKTSSVNFNSRLLKFNTPAKNNLPGE